MIGLTPTGWLWGWLSFVPGRRVSVTSRVTDVGFVLIASINNEDAAAGTGESLDHAIRDLCDDCKKKGLLP